MQLLAQEARPVMSWQHDVLALNLAVTCRFRHLTVATIVAVAAALCACQFEPECRSFAGAFDKANRAAMRFYDAFGDGKPEA